MGTLCWKLIDWWEMVFNRSISSGKFPTEWKEANLSPIFKTDNKQDSNNYRPISLLSNVGKILERQVFMKFYEYCIKNGLLTWRNSTYKARDSTINQLSYIVHNIYDSLAQGLDVCFLTWCKCCIWPCLAWWPDLQTQTVWCSGRHAKLVYWLFVWSKTESGHWWLPFRLDIF